ncbi:MAG: RHS repeat-associated core domain-containing protein, partial [Gemmatimonadales bacterium]
SFIYDGYNHLYGIQDMTGRTTKMWVNPSYSHLVYDSLSSDPSRPLTTRFDYVIVDSATRTLILTQIRGVIGDTTTVELDSTFYLRPVRVNLPRVADETGTWLRPQISYTAYERQGYGALRPLDSVYVEVKDPLNHWTRSLPNRWGQARKTWDALGLLAKATYDPDGFLLSSEGKNGDSSRTYTAYDGNQRVVKSFIVRAAGDTLRGDSLVYNGNHWVVKTIDNRGKVDSVAYDASGNVIYHQDPAGNVTRTWYNGAGQADSVLMPGASKARWFRYDYATGNSWQTYDEAGNLVKVAAFDQFGRDTTTDQKVRVQQSGSAYTWQWRRVRRYYNLYNAVDSTTLIRTANCTGGCPNPTWPSYTDTTKTQHVRYIKDRAGRDSLRVDDRGYATRYQLDRLGRVLVRTPRTTMPAVYDSMAYDLAGNPRKTITRRGHTIVNTYDSRNRLLTTSVPGVGVYRREYQGPLDQLTRIWVDSLVDSLGGVKPDLSWSYDQRGRLKGDTVWTGATARVTTYTTDSLERPSTMADAMGTWTTRYETSRGMADTLITPFGDTISYAFDPQGRAQGPTIRGNGPRLAVSPDWNVTGQLSQLTATVGAGSYSPLTYLMADADEDSLAMPLVPYWLERHGAGAGLDSLRDSVVYDGWERVTQWRGMKKAAGAGSWQSVIRSYTFDRAGNVSTGTGGESYNPITNQLSSHTVGADTNTNYFDAAGNLDSVRVKRRVLLTDRWVYTWDPLNRLIAARHNDTLIVRYAYDVQGRRIAKDVYSGSTGGTTGLTQFVYHGSHVAYEVQSGNINSKYTWGLGTDDLIAVRTGTDTTSHYYAVKDKLGSIRALVKRDCTWVTGTRYGPYGEVLDSAGTSIGLRYGWTGREYDAETGWYYFRARYYDPRQQRFVSEDPIGYGGGGNLYAYVNGAVTEARDPSGLQSENDLFAASAYQNYLTSISCMGSAAYTLDGISVGCGAGAMFAQNPFNSASDVADGLVDWVWGSQRTAHKYSKICAADRAANSTCGKFVDYLAAAARQAGSAREFMLKVGKEIAGFPNGTPTLHFGPSDAAITAGWGEDGFRRDLIDKDGHPWRHFSANMVTGYFYGSGAVDFTILWELKPWPMNGGNSMADVKLGYIGVGYGTLIRRGVISIKELAGYLR